VPGKQDEDVSVVIKWNGLDGLVVGWCAFLLIGIDPFVVML